MRYTKAPLSIDDQAQRLQDRGLLCSSPERLKHYLANIGYYRLSAYWLPFESPPRQDQTRNHQFIPGTTFDAVLHLYIFDRKLRLLVMDAIERIEVAVRTRWAGAIALRHGPHAQMDSKLFKNPWQHARDLAKIAAELEESLETFVVHYRTHYREPFLPPVWAVVETMSLGTLSRWLKNTQDNEVKKEVMQGMRMPTIEILESVLHALTPVRNVCAHHGRLWNRRFVMSLPDIRRFSDRMVHSTAPNHQAHHLFNYLVVIEYLMSVINPRGSWKRRLIELLGTVGAAEHQAMGFPADWQTRSPWQVAP